MTKSPEVSVLLPFYNAESTLANAIESILNQSFKDFELILIDNASGDQSRKIASIYTQKDPRVELLREQKKGVVFATNAAIQYAKGDLLARMDADDFSYPERLEKQVDLLKSDKELGLVSGLVIYGGNTSNGGFIRYVDWLNQIRCHDDIYLNRFVEYPVVNPSIMVRKYLIEEHGAYREGDFPEDYEFFLRLLSNGVKMGKVEIDVLKWSDLASRLTRTNNKYSPDAFFRIKAKYISDTLKENTIQEVLIWGGGKKARQRSSYLKEHGITIAGYIDVVDSDTTIHFSEIKSPKDGFILSYIGSWDAREEVRTYLLSKGFEEGKDFFLCA